MSNLRVFLTYCVVIGEPALFSYCYGALKTEVRPHLFDQGRLTMWWELIALYTVVCTVVFLITALLMLPPHSRFSPLGFQFYADCLVLILLAYVTALLGDSTTRERLADVGLQWAWAVPMGGLVGWAILMRWKWRYLFRTRGAEQDEDCHS